MSGNGVIDRRPGILTGFKIVYILGVDADNVDFPFEDKIDRFLETLGFVFTSKGINPATMERDISYIKKF